MDENKKEKPQPPYHTIKDFFDSLEDEHLRIAWEFITEGNDFSLGYGPLGSPYHDKEINESLKNDIMKQIMIAKKAHIKEFQTEDGTIDWIWKKLFKRVIKRRLDGTPLRGLKWWLYYPCFIYSIAPFVKKFLYSRQYLQRHSRS